MDKAFWEDVKNVWTMKVSLEPERLPKEDEISFEELDFDAAFDAIMAGKNIPGQEWESFNAEKVSEELQKLEEPDAPSRPKLNIEAFENLMNRQDIPSYIEAGKLLLDCQLPKAMDELYRELLRRMEALEDSCVKFKDIYNADIESFCEFYIPEAFQITSSYLDYLDLGIEEDMIVESEAEVMEALEKLLLAVNEKIEEIHKFATIELRAQAKALDAMMSQGGYVKSEFKL